MMDRKQKKWVLGAGLMALFISNLNVQNIAAFLPTFVEERTDWESDDDYKLDSVDISLILTMYSVSQIIFAPINSILKNFFGTKNQILIGFVLLAVTTTGLALVARFKNPHTFLWVAMVLRFFQG